MGSLHGEARAIGCDRKIHAARSAKIDGLKVLAIESRRDVKAAICEHHGKPAQCLSISYAQGNVVRDARAGVTWPMGRSAEKINGNRQVSGAIKEAEHRAFLTKLLEAQSLCQKFRRV